MHPQLNLSCFVFAVALASVSRAQAPIDASKAAAGSSTAPSAVTPPHSALTGPASDDFNRPDASTLGPNWLVQAGAFKIHNNHGGTAISTSSYPWVQHVSAGASYDMSTATIDFLPASSPSVIYVALIFGTGAGNDNIFIKVQDNDANGQYDRVYFYRGINGNAWNVNASFPLTTATTAGRMTCYFTSNGDVANCDIDGDFNGTVDDHFTCSGILAAGMNLGTATGIGCYGLPEFDNWNFNGGTPVLEYCTSGTTTHGCVPVIGGIGTPSASASSGFTLLCGNVEGQKQGIIFYGISGQVAQPWGTSTSWFCVKTPTQRLATQNSGGTLNQCDGQLSTDLLAFIANNPGSLGAPFSSGNQVFAQGWFRDPPSPKHTMLSDALQITLGP